MTRTLCYYDDKMKFKQSQYDGDCVVVKDFPVILLPWSITALGDGKVVVATAVGFDPFQLNLTLTSHASSRRPTLEIRRRFLKLAAEILLFQRRPFSSSL